MKRNILLSLFCTVSSLLLAQEKSIFAETKIKRVIVFMKGAQIERSAQVAIPAGKSEILFKGLSSEIEEQSIQVKGTGRFTILSVSKQADFLHAEQVADALTGLQDKISGLKEQQEIQQNTIDILKKEEMILASNQDIGNGGTGLDLNKLKLALDFQKSRLSENKIKQLSTKREIARLDLQIAKLEKQLKEEAGRPSARTSDIVVKVDAKAAVNGNFDLSYLVKNASWYPSYDIRATDISNPVQLVYRANVAQQSGEEWKDVKLILSSGNPETGGTKPTLRPYQIGFNLSYIPQVAGLSSVKGKVTDAQNNEPLPGVTIRVKGTTIASVADINGNYTIQIPSSSSILLYFYVGYESQERTANAADISVSLRSSSNSLSEVVVTGYGSGFDKELKRRTAGLSVTATFMAKKESYALEVDARENQTNVQFEVVQPYSIGTDGKLLTVEIAQHALKADYLYYAVPKLSQEAWLTASVTGISALNLLSGEASVFFDGAYLGKTLLNAESTRDTLSVSLGADKTVVIKRVPQNEQNSRSTIGSNQKATKAFNIEIFSKKSQPVHLIVEDQIPVSRSSEVSVELQESSGAIQEDTGGMLKWDVQLQAVERKTLKLKYQVKYPKGRQVNIE